MAQATLLGPTAKIVLVVLWMVVTVGIGSNWIYKISRQGNVGDIASARIVLSLTEDLRRLNLRFGILHVRDGKDEVPDHGELKNEIIPFEAIDHQGTLVAVIALCDRGIERVAERLKLGFLFLPHGHLGHRSVLRSLFDFSSNGMSIGGQSIGPQSQLDG